MADAGEESTEDRLLGGAVRLLQPARGHRAGTDAVLLAATAEVAAGDHVVDLGSGTGAVGLMIACRTAATRVTLVERDEAMVALCRRNIALNGLSDRAEAVAADVFHLADAAGPSLREADLVVSNPPYFEAGANRASPDRGRRSAHEMAGGTLADWLGAAAGMLRPKGRLLVVHRADATAELLGSAGRVLGSFVLTFVHPAAGKSASRVLLGAVRGGRSPLRVAPPLVLHGPDGRFTPEADRLHRGDWPARDTAAGRPASTQ